MALEEITIFRLWERDARQAAGSIKSRSEEGKLGPFRAGDERSLRELFNVAQDTDAPHTCSTTSSSFEETLGPFGVAELHGFGKTGRSRTYQNVLDANRGKITDGPTVARFSLNVRVSAPSSSSSSSSSFSASAPATAPAPRLTGALILAERIHAALVELSDGSATFTGCDREGRPLSGHAHAYVLCESNPALGRGRGGEITHVTVYAPASFGPSETAALENLSEVCGSGLAVQLTLQGLGRPEDFGGTDASRGESPLLAKSRTWTSRTPFVPTRHPKSTRAGAPKLDSTGLQIGSPEHELRRLIGLAGLPAPSTVEPVTFTDLAEQRTGWSSFRRARSLGGGRRAGSAGYGFRIEFSESVQGPVALGYGAHFGMGGFVGEDRGGNDLMMGRKWMGQGRVKP